MQKENAFLWRTSLYLAASASAEFFADIGLAPLEAVKVRIQTKPGEFLFFILFKIYTWQMWVNEFHSKSLLIIIVLKHFWD